MSHNLNVVAGVVNAVYATGKHGLPWHILGTMVKEALTWSDAAKLAHMDFTVSKHPLISPFDGKELSTWGIFRDDSKDLLGSVGSVYEPIQIADNFQNVDTLLEQISGAHYEAAGLLGKGSKYWLLARIPQSFKIKGTDDKHDFYVMVYSSHDGTIKNTIKITDVRAVCQNTINMAISGKGASLVVKHTASGAEKITAAKALVTGIEQTVESLSEKLNKLASKKVNKEMNLKIMEKLFGADWKDSTRKRNQIEQIAALYDKNDNNAIPEVKGTAYNLLNAVTEYTDHYRDVRITDSRSGMTEQQARAESAFFGGAGETMKSNALETILELTAELPEIAPKIYSKPSPASASMKKILASVAL